METLSDEMKKVTPLVERKYDKVLILIRHADAGGDQSDCASLTEVGLSQAKNLNRYLEEKYPHIERIFSSMTQRAVETTSCIKGLFKLQANRLFVEHDAPTDDSWPGIKGRVLDAITEATKNPQERVVAIVSHGRFLRSFLLGLFYGESLTLDMVKRQMLAMSCTGISLVGHLRGSKAGKGWVLLRWNDGGCIPDIDSDWLHM